MLFIIARTCRIAADYWPSIGAYCAS